MISLSEFEENCARLFVKPETREGKFLHACVGIAGEAGELLDAVKKYWIYGAVLDKKNVLEECGDILFYLSQAGRQLNVPFEFFNRRSPYKNEATSAYLVATVSSIVKISADLLDIANAWFNVAQFGAELSVDGQVGFRKNATWLFYEIECLLYSLDFSINDAMRSNVSKLSKRYPQGYTDQAAIDRADKQEIANAD